MECVLQRSFALVRAMTCGVRLLKNFTPITCDWHRGKHSKRCPNVPSRDSNINPCEDNLLILCPVPRKRFAEVIEHVIRYQRKNLNLGVRYHKYNKKKRRSQICTSTEAILKQFMSAAAIRGADKKGRGGTVVSVALCKVVKCDDIMNTDPKCLGNKDDDELIRNVQRMIVYVHQDLNLFHHFQVEEILCISVATTEEQKKKDGCVTTKQKSNELEPCCRAVSAALEHAFIKGLKAVKSDCLGKRMARCVEKAGLSKIFTLKYDDYHLGGEKCIFAGTAPPDDKLRVYAGHIICEPPHVCPVDDFIYTKIC